MAAMLAELRGSFCRVVTDHETSSRSFPDRIKAAKGLSRWLWTVEANRWRTFERRALRQVDFVVTLSEADRDAFSAMHPDVPVEYVPIATRIPAEPLDALGVDPPQILFVGNFIHPPNVDAALRMASSIFPIVKSKVPDATLVIAGDHPPAELRALASPSVKVTGWVPDLTAYLNDAAVVVAPVRTGGGSRVKVAEALAHGKAVIGTSLAFAGLPVSSNEAVVVDSDNELATAIVHLLSDVSRRARIGRAARAFALAHLGADRTAAAYEALYDQIQR